MRPYVCGPLLDALPEAEFALGGGMGGRLQALIENWILPTPEANPAILEMFRNRDRKPLHNMVPWAGEFAGKYLTHAVQILRLTRNEELERHLCLFVKELTALQAEDGYLGPWPKKCRLTGNAPNCFGNSDLYNPDPPGPIPTWDAWGHYHVMLGMILWHDLTGDRSALRCAGRIGDLFCRTFLETGKRLVSIGEDDKNLAPIHALCLLYRRTGEQRYLAMARAIEKDFETPPAGDYLRTALAGKEFFETPRPRWESLHAIQGLAELYCITGEQKYRDAFEHIWWSIARLDRHNNGGFSSGEKASGDPYHQGMIETCCTVAWMAMSVDMLRLTGDPVVVDELELSMLNSGLGMMAANGRWVTYNTPMDGRRIASPNDCTSFQARPGQPELNCCSVNGPRALGMLCDWAVMRSGDSLVVNYYGPGRISLPAANGRGGVTLIQETSYPADGRVRIKVEPERSTALALKLRIPHWSAGTRVAVNGNSAGKAGPGSYFTIDRRWRRGDTVTLALDMSLHFWKGNGECAGKTSVYRGPVLLACDPRFNDVDPDKLPVLNARNLSAKRIRLRSWLPPSQLWEFQAGQGRRLRLCDFASAGMAGDPYRSWLRVSNVRAVPFSRKTPLRSGRITS